MELYLAPLQGMTTASYRNLHAEFFGGLDAYYAPFISTSDPSAFSKKLFTDLLPEDNSSIDVIPQLIGCTGKDFNHYAKYLVELGYTEINWNIGCPFHPVTKKKKGSGLLPYPELVERFLDEVCGGANYELSVKMRIGMNHLDEGIEILKILNHFPIKNVTIHPRVGKQKYEGTVDLDAFDTLSKQSRCEVIYNGDINSVADFQRVQERFPQIRKFMIGRGVLRDPFLPARIKGETFTEEDVVSKIKQFHDAFFHQLTEVYTAEIHACNKMKEFWYYLHAFVDPEGQYIERIKRTTTIEQYLDVADAMLHAFAYNKRGR